MGIATGSLFALIFRVMSLFFWGIIGIITARTLTVDDRGVYAAAVIVGAVISAILSFSAAASFLVANQHRDEAEVAWHGLLLSLVAAVPVAAGAFLAAAVVPSDLRWITILVGLGVVPTVLRLTLNGVLLGSHRLHRYNVSTNAGPAAGLLLIVIWVALLQHRTATQALAAWTAGQYLALLPIAFWGGGWWTKRLAAIDRRIVVRMLTFGAVTGAATVINFFNYRVDVLMVIGLDSREGAGIYSSSVALAEALWLFSSAIAVASYSRVGSTTRAEAGRLTALAVRHTLLVVTVGAVVVALLAPTVLGILFGPAYRAGAEPLRILCIGTAANAPATLLANYFTVQLGRPAIALWLAALSCFISVGIGFALIPSLGTAGAAWATTISYTVTAAIAVAAFLVASGVSPSELWRIRSDDLASYVRLARRILKATGLRESAAAGGS